MLGDTESEASWSEFFGLLKSRGLKGVDMIVSDRSALISRASPDSGAKPISIIISSMPHDTSRLYGKGLSFQMLSDSRAALF
jgi:hypothetical protein